MSGRAMRGLTCGKAAFAPGFQLSICGAGSMDAAAFADTHVATDRGKSDH